MTALSIAWGLSAMSISRLVAFPSPRVGSVSATRPWWAPSSTVSIIQDLIKDAKGKDKEAFQNLIVMKPTINEDLLEDLIYNKQLDPEVVKPAIVESVSYMLRFKKSKKKTSKSRKNS